MSCPLLTYYAPNSRSSPRLFSFLRNEVSIVTRGWPILNATFTGPLSLLITLVVPKLLNERLGGHFTIQNSCAASTQKTAHVYQCLPLELCWPYQGSPGSCSILSSKTPNEHRGIRYSTPSIGGSPQASLC
ncbi:hypothetical protein BDZ94DRAFT_321199 [Collybia nuda]|uniref:Uncharacterized protein n=1 Tax=Collybia nuda TaxID=64659 RepID=A0A9P6CD80_9AGAR|nr:hypothetical protein BDZ94DRAFT_321199 [Collybia nuda]